MTFRNNKTCRRTSCRRKAHQTRKKEQRRRVKCLIPHAQFLLIPGAGALYQQRKYKYDARREPPFELDMNDEVSYDEVAIDNNDLQVMRSSVELMQQQLSRGLKDLEEICALVKEALTQRENERREMATRRPQHSENTLFN